MKVLIILLTGIGMVGCGNASSQSHDMQAEIARFHADYNAGNHDAIYSRGSTSFKCSIDLESLAARLAKARSTFGQFQSSEYFDRASSWALINLTPAAMLVSTFEEGEVTESFYFVRENGSYRINRLMLMQPIGEPVRSEDGTAFSMDSFAIAIPAVNLDCD